VAGSTKHSDGRPVDSDVLSQNRMSESTADGIANDSDPAGQSLRDSERSRLDSRITATERDELFPVREGKNARSQRNATSPYTCLESIDECEVTDHCGHLGPPTSFGKMQMQMHTVQRLDST